MDEGLTVELRGVCPNGHIFPSGVQIAMTPSGTTATVLVGACPTCGRSGELADSDWVGTTVRRMLRASPTELVMLQTVVNMAQSGQLRSSGTLTIPAGLSPETQTVIATALEGPQSVWRMRIVSAILTLLLWAHAPEGAALGHHLDHDLEQGVAWVLHELSQPPIGGG